MVPLHSCHISGIWRNKVVGERFKIIIWGSKASCKRRGPVFMGKEGFHYVILLFRNFILSLIGYCKRLYRISYFFKDIKLG